MLPFFVLRPLLAPGWSDREVENFQSGWERTGRIGITRAMRGNHIPSCKKSKSPNSVWVPLASSRSNWPRRSRGWRSSEASTSTQQRWPQSGRVDRRQGLERARVHGSIAELCQAAGKPDVILHTASSSAAASLAQVRDALEAGISIASTCEELIFPRLKTPEVAAEYDALCRRTGARVVGTGVNPGFVMDILPICLTGVTRRVDSIYVERVVNASTRRQPLQAKIGSGQAPDDFRAKFKAGKAGHAIQQSLALLAHAMGWILESIEETCEPLLAPAPIVTQFFNVARGQTCGLHQHAIGRVDGQAKLILDLQMFSIRTPTTRW